MKLADAHIIRLEHFTPASKAHWCWMFFAPVMTLLPGPQTTIMGTVIIDYPGSQLWEGVSGTPKFATRDEAQEWAAANGVVISMVEVEYEGVTP